MNDVKETLDKLVPEPARMSDWDTVLREARPRSRSGVLQLAVATGLAGLAALFVVAPWKGSERVGILDRALAAVGDGPVLHVVFRGDWGGTLVDLKTGGRKPLHGEREVWFDPDRGLVHHVSRFGGVVEHEEVYERSAKDRELTALWQDYRRGLEQDTARVVGKDAIGGIPVYWIIVQSQMLPDVADNKDHEFAQQVAISRETFKPVAMRYTRDRQAPKGSTEYILRFETISREEADFTSNPEASLDGRAMMQGSDPIGIEQAAEILGRAPFWLGPEYAGFPLRQAQKTFSSTGMSKETLVTGERADAIRRCLAARRPSSRAAPRACPRTTGSIAIRNGNVYEMGKPEFGPRQTGVTFFYGKLGDNPTTFKKEDSVPLYAEPHIVLTQTTQRGLIVHGPPIAYVPPEGSVVLRAGLTGYLVRDGVHITLRAGSDEQILDAAGALRSMPSAESGADG